MLRANTLIALTEEAKYYYRKLGLDNQIRVVPNGIKTGDYHQKQVGEFDS